MRSRARGRSSQPRLPPERSSCESRSCRHCSTAQVAILLDLPVACGRPDRAGRRAPTPGRHRPNGSRPRQARGRGNKAAGTRLASLPPAPAYARRLRPRRRLLRARRCFAFARVIVTLPLVVTSQAHRGEAAARLTTASHPPRADRAWLRSSSPARTDAHAEGPALSAATKSRLQRREASSRACATHSPGDPAMQARLCRAGVWAPRNLPS